jgi:ornithine cyclodeaminase/alanine dehydrogenase-like protein (mu-crystallin family)
MTGALRLEPTMQELPDAVYAQAGLLAVDSLHALHEVGDVINPLRRGILEESDVFAITECVKGKRSISIARTTAYESVGAAIFDVYVARAPFQAATSQGIGREIVI